MTFIFSKQRQLPLNCQPTIRGPGIPQFDDIELSAHQIGQRLGRAIQEERDVLAQVQKLLLGSRQEKHLDSNQHLLDYPDDPEMQASLEAAKREAEQEIEQITYDRKKRRTAKVRNSSPEFSTIRSTPHKRARNRYSFNPAKNATIIRPVTVPVVGEAGVGVKVFASKTENNRVVRIGLVG